MRRGKEKNMKYQRIVRQEHFKDTGINKERLKSGLDIQSDEFLMDSAHMKNRIETSSFSFKTSQNCKLLRRMLQMLNLTQEVIISRCSEGISNYLKKYGKLWDLFFKIQFGPSEFCLSVLLLSSDS